MADWFHDPNLEDPSFNEFMKKLQPRKRILPELDPMGPAPEPTVKDMGGEINPSGPAPAAPAPALPTPAAGGPFPWAGPKGSAREQARVEETDAPPPATGYQNPGAFVGHPVMGTTPAQMAQANGPRTLSLREVERERGKSGAYVGVGFDKYAPAGMSEFEANARFNPEEGFRRFLMQHSPAQGHMALPVAERVALANTYQGLTKGFGEQDKMGLERYLGIAGAATAARGAGVSERQAGVGERAQTEAEAQGQYGRSRSLTAEKFYDAMKAMGLDDAAATAALQARNRVLPGGTGTSVRNAAQAGASGGGNRTVEDYTGTNPPGGVTDPNAPPPLSDEMRFTDTFGPDAYTAAKKSTSMAEAVIALRRKMGDEKFKRLLPTVQEYVSGRTEPGFGGRAWGKFVNPGGWSRSFQNIGNIFGAPGEEQLAVDMIRNQHLLSGTPEQKKAAQEYMSNRSFSERLYGH